MENSGWNMYVFRDGRRIVPGQRLVSELRDSLAALEQGRCLSQDRLLDALVAAGELECALTDAGSELGGLRGGNQRRCRRRCWFRAADRIQAKDNPSGRIPCGHYWRSWSLSRRRSNCASVSTRALPITRCTR